MKIFGATPMGRIDEYNPRITTCLYSNTKNSAFDLIAHYRQNYRIAASNLILFNHESSRRPRGFFIPDLAACLSDALDDPNATRGFRTLDFYADWSDAAEFMDLAIDVAELTDGVDLIFASGITWYGRDFARRLFEAYGLDYTRHVSEGVPTNSAAAFEACIGRLEQTVGRRPLRSIFSIMNDLLPQRHRIKPVPTR